MSLPTTPTVDPSAKAPVQAPSPENARPEKSSPMHRQRALDGLRFVAAFSVALFHLAAVAGTGAGTANPVNIWGEPARDVFGGLFVLSAYLWVGVPLFFMISGFVICMSGWGRTPAQFAISRIVRLYPAYWTAIAITVGLVLIYPALFNPPKIWDILANLTMVQGQLGAPNVDGVYWTLLVELKFYLLFAVLLWRGIDYRRTVAFCVLWSIASLLAAETNFPVLKAIFLPAYAQYFVAGIAFYLIYRFGSNFVLWGLVGYSWIIAMRFHNDIPFALDAGLPGWPSAVLITGGFAVLALLALRKLEWLRWRGLTTLGATTYPLYLLHYTVGTSLCYLLVKRLDASPWLILASMLILLILASWLVHRLVERPLAPLFKRRLVSAVEQIRARSRGGLPG